VFVQGDIGDRELVSSLLKAHKVHAVVNFAAESHVDRSIDGPAITGVRSMTRRRRIFVSCTFPRTRYTVRWGPKVSSRKPPLTRPILPTLRPKRLPTIWFARFITRTACPY
jgi:hypothetical protein